jgi:hypothetical protein
VKKRRLSTYALLLMRKHRVREELARIFDDPRLADPTLARDQVMRSIWARYEQLEKKERRLHALSELVRRRDLRATRHRLYLVRVAGLLAFTWALLLRALTALRDSVVELCQLATALLAHSWRSFLALIEHAPPTLSLALASNAPPTAVSLLARPLTPRVKP